jgi:glycerol-3-phosphate acyltransferase PlsX
VKSHGGANAAGIANALDVADKLVRDDINRRIAAELDNLRAHRGDATTPLDAA